MTNEEEKAAPPEDTNQAVPPEGQIPAKKIRRSFSLWLHVILGLFVPVWIGVGIALMTLWKDFPPFVIACMFAGSFVVCALVALVQLIRAKTDDPTQKPALFVLLVVDAFLVFPISNALTALQFKVDRIYTVENMVKVLNCLEDYIRDHGSFPPQQDFGSLLKTLDIQKSDFRKTLFYSIESAEYHALDGSTFSRLFDPLPPTQNREERVLTLPIKRKLFGDFDELIVLRRDGSIGYDYESPENKTPTSEQKPKPDQSILIREETK
ncbi:MAG: hypothetical protein IJT68_07990 [Lentisphaeria bacterium]|nr:hypothetical protein [Lentisphaeria bacterium]